MTRTPVCGRFAPSPTGPLHFGSLVAAVGSYLDARHRGGRWLVRMEDLDPPREQPGAAARILRTLERFGLEWDGEVIYQSRRLEHYEAAIERLRRDGIVYYCTCSRKTLRQAQKDGVNGTPYPGTCRDQTGFTADAALRLRTDAVEIGFTDACQGYYAQRLGREVGDFVIKRRDGYHAYQLAVVVDDAEQGITEVVRGSDLLDSTPRQIHLQRCLGLDTPAYLHLPVAVNAAGHKLGKQTGAAAVDEKDPAATLLAVLRFLGQAPPAPLSTASPDEILQWARAHWSRQRIPRVKALCHHGH